jgi:uncharacterized protein (TIGR03067 family)
MRRALLLSAVVCVAFAPAPFPKQRQRADDGRRDLQAMQGVWAERFADSAAVTIAGDRMEYHPDHAWKITLNGRANPKRIEAVGIGSEVVGKTRSGIYRLEEGKLIICWRWRSAGNLDWPPCLDPFQKDVWIEVFTQVKR